MEQVMKAAAIAIVSILFSLLIKKNNPSGALLVSVGAGSALFVLLFSILAPVIRFMKELTETAGISSALFQPLLKSLGIALLTKFASDACGDAGEKMLATGVELVGSAASLYVSLPLMSAVLSTAKSFLSS